MLLMQLAVLVVVVAGGYLLTSAVLHDDLVDQYEQRALAIARSVAADPIYADRVEAEDRSGIVQERAEAVRERTGALFVVVTDDQGIRYSHPNPDNIGKPVSTDPSVALAGGEVTAFERGTLGLSARGKVPLRNAAGGVVGEVSVGIDAESIDDQEAALRLRTASLLGLALLVGAGGAFALNRRLKRQTFGLEPRELADLLREREAVVHGVQDGVLAVDRFRAGHRVQRGRRDAARATPPGGYPDRRRRPVTTTSRRHREPPARPGHAHRRRRPGPRRHQPTRRARRP